MKAVYRRVADMGRIVLPMQMRNALGIREKDLLEVSMDKEAGIIQLKKAEKSCLRCGSSKKLVDIVMGYSLCDACLDRMIEERQTAAE